MKQIIKAIAILILSTTIIYGQNFCGHIKYSYTYIKNKNGADVTTKVKDIKTEDFYICGNKFKEYFDGNLDAIYIGDSLTYFHVKPGKIIGYVKADSAYGQLLPKYINPQFNVRYKSKTYNSIDKISSDGRITYYFNDDLKIDPLLLEKLELYHWNKFFNVTNGAIRIISISRTKKLTIISEAVEIKQINLLDKDFYPPNEYEIKPFDFFWIEN